MGIRNWLRAKGISRTGIKEFLTRSITSDWFMVLTWTASQRRTILLTWDPVRYGTVDLALAQIVKEKIPGALAEGGVFQGMMSRFIHERIPDKVLYLFDTFEGFDVRDSHSRADDRFKDTSENRVRQYIGDMKNIVIKKGFFPDTTEGLEREKYAFVMIDFDKYEPTLAALKYFYPRTHPGGFIIVHDYSSPESHWACSRALDEFLSDKPEKPVLIPDRWGTALFRKV